MNIPGYMGNLYILYTLSAFRLQVVEVRELLSKGIGVHHGGILPLLKGERDTTMVYINHIQGKSGICHATGA